MREGRPRPISLSAPNLRIGGMVTQALFGERVSMSPVEGALNWAAIRLHSDGYEGFMDPKLVDTSDAAVDAFDGPTWLLDRPLTGIEWEGRTLHLPAGSRIPQAAQAAFTQSNLEDVVSAASSSWALLICGAERASWASTAVD